MHTCNTYVAYKSADLLFDSTVLILDGQYIGQKQFQILAKMELTRVAHTQIDLAIREFSIRIG